MLRKLWEKKRAVKRTRSRKTENYENEAVRTEKKEFSFLNRKRSGGSEQLKVTKNRME